MTHELSGELRRLLEENAEDWCPLCNLAPRLLSALERLERAEALLREAMEASTTLDAEHSYDGIVEYFAGRLAYLRGMHKGSQSSAIRATSQAQRIKDVSMKTDAERVIELTAANALLKRESLVDQERVEMANAEVSRLQRLLKSADQAGLVEALWRQLDLAERIIGTYADYRTNKEYFNSTARAELLKRNKPTSTASE